MTRFFLAVALAIVAWPVARAQALLERPDLDIVGDGEVAAVVHQPNGGVIFSGGFTAVNGVPRSGLARLLPDGTLDPDWNPSPAGHVSVLAIDGNAHVYVAGTFASIGGIAQPHLAKLDGGGTGSVDASWRPQAENAIVTLVVDGNDLFAGGFFNTIGGQARPDVAKLSKQTGALDPAWAPTLGFGNVDALAVVGQVVYIGGYFTSINGQPLKHLVRVARGGSGVLDTNWNAAPDERVYSLAFDGAQTLYVGGLFTNIGGGARPYLTRMSVATGQFDPNWTPQPNGRVEGLALGGGALYAIGAFTTVGGAAHYANARLSLDTGAADPAWTNRPTGTPSAVSVSTDGNRIALAGAARMTGKPFSQIATFDRNGTQDTRVEPSLPASVRLFAPQPDGGMVIAGSFQRIDGHDRNGLARVLPDGSLDTAWRADTDRPVFALAVNGAGDIYVGGAFENIGGLPRTSIAKLSASGVVDAQWNPGQGPTRIRTFALDADGSVYVGGLFDRIGGQARPNIAKLDGAGTGAADPAWTLFANDAVNTLVLDGAGSLYVGGEYSVIGGQSRGNLARIATAGAGTVDAQWTPASDGLVNAIALRGESVYVAGDFEAVNGFARHNLAKLSRAAGAVDAAWNPSLDALSIESLAVDGAGTVYAAGVRFVSVGIVRSVLAKIAGRGTGVIDAAWPPEILGLDLYRVMIVRGSLYLAGYIVGIGDERRYGFAAFDNDVIFGDGAEP